MLIKQNSQNSNLRNAINKITLKLKDSMNGNNDLIDRRLVNKLLITFIDRYQNNGDTNEILNLMSNMLKFSKTENEKINAGIKQNKNRSGLWGNMFGISNYVFGSDGGVNELNNNKNDVNRNSKALADLWVDFY